MPSRPRSPAQPIPPATRHKPHPRPWATLPARSQKQLAQRIARLLRRVREEARHAEHP